MKKQIAVALLIANTNFIGAMKDEAFSFLSSFSSSQRANESILVSNLRAKINELENKLRNEKVKQYFTCNDMLTLARPFNMFSISNPDKLLQYCYYLKFYKNQFNLHLFELDNRIINDCKKAQLNGYSAIGASIIADDTTTQEKRNFIQKLIHLGFKPTTKDIELAKLALYDAIAKHRKTLLHLLHSHSEINWSALPQEIRAQIVQYLVQLHWLLPETSLNNV